MRRNGLPMSSGAMELRLLIECEGEDGEDGLSLEGRTLHLSQALDLSDSASIPPFACISYVWGAGRETHATDDTLLMSTRTRPALASAIRVSECHAYWTDVFCLPTDGSARQSTLENMGYIYSRAAEVIVVLGEDVFSVIEEMIRHAIVSHTQLQVLERDEWISSVWTYQEVVNGRSVRFMSRDKQERTTAIGCTEFFSALGAGLAQLEKSSSLDTFDVVRALPNVSALEEILADWQTADYRCRSALRVFSSMSRKRNKLIANYYYAILGAITDSSHELVWNPDQNLAEKVMSICERKNDFSFIYTMAARDADPDRCWRPRHDFDLEIEGQIPPVLQPILSWHCWGEAQTGRYDGERLWLHEMIVMRLKAAVREVGLAALSRWLQKDIQDQNEEVIGEAVHTSLIGMGFQGSAVPLTVSDGLCFAIEVIDPKTVLRVIVSSQIRWPMGAPGLVHWESDGNKHYAPCVFVGEIISPQSSPESIML